MKGLYIHIPFCHKKCFYCSFYSTTNLSLIPSYLEALDKELEFKRNVYPNFFKKGVATLYIGGGNPAILSLKDIEKILEKVYSLNFYFKEITIEANPDSLSDDKVKEYKNLGINRISLGIQSFDDNVLKILGRNHSEKEAERGLNIVKKYFDNFSIDIIGGIYGLLEGKNISRNFKRELKKIKDYDPPHISFYLLTIEKNTPFYGSFILDDDLQVTDYEMFIEFARENGYIHYEISNFAKKSFECKHNRIYWERGDYIGLGPSACSFLKGEREVRIKNSSNLFKYLKRPTFSRIEYLDQKDILSESIFLSLRTAKGLNFSTIQRDFPEKAPDIYERLLALKKSGFIKQKKGRWIIEEKSFIISNEIIAEILKGVEL